MLKLHKIFPEEVRCNTCMKGTTETFFEGNWIDDEKALIQNLKFHVINRQLNKFTKYDVTV